MGEALVHHLKDELVLLLAGLRDLLWDAQEENLGIVQDLLWYIWGRNQKWGKR